MIVGPRRRWPLRFAVALAVGLATLLSGTSARSEAAPSAASEAARNVINSGPYQRNFPGEQNSRQVRPRRSGGSGVPRWRIPEDSLPSRATTDAASGALAAVGAVVGGVVVIGLLLAAWAWMRGMRHRRSKTEAIEDEAPSHATSLAVSDVDRMIHEARALLAAGQGRDAVLLLWRHGVAVLLYKGPRETREDDDLTGREVVRALVARGGTEVTRLNGLKVLLREMERAWFGKLAVTETHFTTCEAAFRVILAPQTATGEVAA